MRKENNFKFVQTYVFNILTGPPIASACLGEPVYQDPIAVVHLNCHGMNRDGKLFKALIV